MKTRLISLIVTGGLMLSSSGHAETPAVDPAALTALENMGAHLRSLQTFAVNAADTIDLVQDNGQKIQFATNIALQVRRPNGLRADIDSDAGSRRLYYDGKDFTLLFPDTGFYATVPAKPTLREVLNHVEAKYDMEFPLVDLFTWGKDPEAVKAIRSAMLVGPSKVNGQEADHYAFRQDELDWQLWIARGDAPLPLKYVITTTDVPEQPQYTATLSWDSAAKPDDAVFTFQPAKTQYRIGMVAVDVEDTEQSPTAQ